MMRIPDEPGRYNIGNIDSAGDNMAIAQKKSIGCVRIRKSIASMMVIGFVLMSMVSVFLPWSAQTASAQWTPSTLRTDSNGGTYNWTIDLNAGSDLEPADWAGKLEYLSFFYFYTTMMNSSSLVNDTTINVKGGLTGSWRLSELYYDWLCSTSPSNVSGPGRVVLATEIDPLKFSASDYNLSTMSMILDITFDTAYLKTKGITEISIRFNKTIDRWDGALYYQQPLVTTLKIYPNRILSQDEVDGWWNARGPNKWNNWFEDGTNVSVVKFDDGQGGHYNWTTASYIGDSSDPKEWNGRTMGLYFKYDFSTRVNYTSIINGVTVRLKGTTDRTWGLGDILVETIQPPVWGYYFKDDDRPMFGLKFDINYIKANNISEIDITFNQTIVKWDGGQYFSQPLTVSKPVNSKNFITLDEVNKWRGRSSETNELTSWNVLILVFLASCIPLVLIWVTIGYIELRNKRLVMESSSKKPKKIKVGPNGVAETIMKLMDKSELWMNKRRKFILTTTALTLVFYFLLSGFIFLYVYWAWNVDNMVRWAILMVTIALSWSILGIYSYWYNKFRADDLNWTLKIRTLKKREGDYLADLK
jgi:hypothetical protein